MRQVLRDLPVLQGNPPTSFDADDGAVEPLSVMRRWLQEAIEAGEPEPHAMTLSTVGPDNAPSSRVLICKDIDDKMIYFAGHSTSQKGRDLAANGQAAVTFYWSGLARQVRMVGTAAPQSRALAEKDFEARGRGAKLIALAQRMGALSDDSDLEQAITKVDEAYPSEVPCPETWTVYGLSPHEVEFWQGRSDRRHERRLYFRAGDVWTQTRLWPSG